MHVDLTFQPYWKIAEFEYRALFYYIKNNSKGCRCIKS
uniref:Uncharacterized protein n=1 Tax=Rhizophora mucronata TaxID=61149 RepID=A0A2P2PXT5_RHIMU